MKYDRFENLPVWRAAMDLALRTFALTEDRTFNTDGDVRDQLRRATLSISNNIAEGFERGSTSELLQYLYIARGSAGAAPTGTEASGEGVDQVPGNLRRRRGRAVGAGPVGVPAGGRSVPPSSAQNLAIAVPGAGVIHADAPSSPLANASTPERCSRRFARVAPT